METQAWISAATRPPNGVGTCQPRRPALHKRARIGCTEKGQETKAFVVLLAWLSDSSYPRLVWLSGEDEICEKTLYSTSDLQMDCQCASLPNASNPHFCSRDHCPSNKPDLLTHVSGLNARERSKAGARITNFKQKSQNIFREGCSPVQLEPLDSIRRSLLSYLAAPSAEQTRKTQSLNHVRCDMHNSAKMRRWNVQDVFHLRSVHQHKQGSAQQRTLAFSVA